MIKATDEEIPIDMEKDNISNMLGNADANILIALYKEENEYMDMKKTRRCCSCVYHILALVKIFSTLVQYFAVCLFSILQFHYMSIRKKDIQSTVDAIIVICLVISIYCALADELSIRLNSIELDNRYFSRVVLLKYRKGWVMPIIKTFLSTIIIFVSIASFKSSIFETFWNRVYSIN